MPKHGKHGLREQKKSGNILRIMGEEMTFTIDIEIYDSTIHILNNVPDTEYNSYMKVYFDEVPDRLPNVGCTWTIQDKNNKEHYVIDFQKKLKKDAECMNIIVHESLHVAFAIAEKIMMP